MGYRVLLIAVTGKAPEVIHAEYGVTPTGDYEEVAESPVTSAMLPSGAYLLYVNDEISPNDRVLARLSSHASLLACYANEMVMESSVESWVNGAAKWSVLHDAQQGIQHLQTAGEVPQELKPIQQRLQAKQSAVQDRDVDYIFDIPIELFVALGGIRYDEDIDGAAPDPWQVLARSKRKNSWWPFG
jgi:hypothetical protein